GVYGDRLLRIARAHGIPTRALSYDVTTAARPDDVRMALRAEPQLTHVAVVHHETTTGVLNPVAEIARAAAAEGRRVLVDAMRPALKELEKEGVTERIARYAENARVLRRGMTALGFEILVPEGARSSILTTFKLPPGVAYDPLHDAMKRRGYIIYAGQGDIRKYAFRVSNMGTLTPAVMHDVVEAFAASLAELRQAGGGG